MNEVTKVLDWTKPVGTAYESTGSIINKKGELEFFQYQACPLTCGIR